MADTPVKKAPEKRDVERTSEAECFAPAVDIYETEDALVLQADMPGVTKDNVDVKVEEDVLTLTGKAAMPPQDAAPLYAEYRIGDYYRAFTLSQEIDVDRISAEMTDGVLTLRLPKTDRMKSRKIEVKGK
ncbi:MAG: Hsp20/alpha crystallin family protein [Planctomycetes bacterium]|nr:Hsp20/alpha crystallin family protein [Planctomycetota bacterium]